MAKKETLQEAWENLPAWKKNWIIIVALIVAAGLVFTSIQSCNVEKEHEKFMREGETQLKELEQVDFKMK